MDEFVDGRAAAKRRGGFLVFITESFREQLSCFGTRNRLDLLHALVEDSDRVKRHGTMRMAVASRTVRQYPSRPHT